jgi:hypothetical protein
LKHGKIGDAITEICIGEFSDVWREIIYKLKKRFGETGTIADLPGSGR